MKKKVSAFLCLLMLAVSMTIPTAGAENSLFDVNPDTVDTIKIRTGWGTEHILNVAENAELVQEIIQKLNDFKYKETEEIPPVGGWYVILKITGIDGAEQQIEIGINGAYAPDDTADTRTKYISADPDYFGESWLKLLFPYSFTDVNIWENSSIKSLYDSGLMLGTSETTFSPDTVMTRGMFITVLGRMAEIDEDDYRESSFEDVTESDYFFPYVSWAVGNGVIKGISEKEFSPNDAVTREQALVMLARYAEALELEYPTTTNPFKPRFIDIENTSQEFQEKLSVLHVASIFPPLEDNDIFNPTGMLTRKEAADIFENAYRALYEG